MKLTDFEALSFDCYGTLIDWEAGLSAVLVPWARERGLTLTAEQLLTEYAGLEAAVEAEGPARLYPDVLARSMQLLGAKLGAEVTSEDAARLASSVPDWPAFPDSRDALLALGKRFDLIILSNVDRASFAASSTRLGATFASVITAQDVGSYKPSPRNFDALAAEAAQARHRARPAAARGPEPVPRPPAREAGRAAHRVDQPATRQARLGCHARAARAGDAGLGIPVHGRLRRGRRLGLISAAVRASARPRRSWGDRGRCPGRPFPRAIGAAAPRRAQSGPRPRRSC